MLKWRRGVVAELILGDQVCLFHRPTGSIYTRKMLYPKPHDPPLDMDHTQKFHPYTDITHVYPSGLYKLVCLIFVDFGILPYRDDIEFVYIGRDDGYMYIIAG